MIIPNYIGTTVTKKEPESEADESWEMDVDNCDTPGGIIRMLSWSSYCLYQK